MVLLKIRYHCLRFLVIIVLTGIIYYIRYIGSNVEDVTKYIAKTDNFPEITYGNFNLISRSINYNMIHLYTCFLQEKQELQYLKQFYHLFWLRDIIPNKYVFGTYDKSKNPVAAGNIIIYRMMNSSNEDYVRFMHYKDLRAAYGLRAVKKHIFERETWIPVNKEEFLQKWDNGRFLECIRLNISTSWSKSVIPDDFINNMAKFRDFVESFGATPFLFGGTLLGWYRECAFIKDTTDVDMAMKITSLDLRMLKNMEKSEDFKLFWILGKVNDSLEVSVYSANIKIDLFFVYENEDFAWVGGMIISERKKLRWVYPPISQICTGDLLGRLFHVPCNVEEVLKADYGDWRKPHPTANFTWYESHNNVHEAGYWSESEWNDTYKVF